MGEPVNYSAYEVGMSGKDFSFCFDDCQEYQQTKERCLFEGFELSIGKEAIIYKNNIIRIHKNETFSLNGKQVLFIEDLVKYEPLLTETAKKQIGI